MASLYGGRWRRFSLTGSSGWRRSCRRQRDRPRGAAKTAKAERPPETLECVCTCWASLNLEVVCNADYGVVDVVVLVGRQVWRTGGAKVGNLGKDAAILEANVEAG